MNGDLLEILEEDGALRIGTTYRDKPAMDHFVPIYAAPVAAITAEQKAQAIYAWCSGREWIEPTEDGPMCMIPVALLSDLAAYLDKIGGQ
jgi:hypothetical protein